MLRLALVVLVAFGGAARAVQPDEILPDVGLEQRARAVSQLIRCPVCQGESIDESNAPIARDLRLLVRERLLAGDTDEEAIDYIVQRYGEFVLFLPRSRGANLILWASGPLLFLGALGGAAIYLRRRRAPAGTDAGLSREEEARLEKILKS